MTPVPIEWTEADKAMVGKIAGEICERVTLNHIKSCPHGIKIGKFWMFILGAGIASGYSISEIVRRFLGS